MAGPRYETRPAFGFSFDGHVINNTQAGETPKVNPAPMFCATPCMATLFLNWRLWLCVLPHCAVFGEEHHTVPLDIAYITHED